MITRSLNILTWKNVRYDWSPECYIPFETFKVRLGNLLLFVHFDHCWSTFVSCNVSGHGVGTVLEQEIKENLMPVSFYSSQILPSESNYTIMEKECLAIVRSLKWWEIEPLGIDFIVFTMPQLVQFLLNPSPSLEFINGSLVLLNFVSLLNIDLERPIQFQTSSHVMPTQLDKVFFNIL